MPSVLQEFEAAQKKRSTPLPADTQQVCIDLPGEAIRCVIYKPKLVVTLRKHRDVIFEIALFKGMSYTVEADQSDFYNARDKKLVEFRKKQKVTFADGERLHLWVSRQFKGGLVLKSGNKIIGRYEPDLLDSTQYSDEPGNKPAPLIVLLKNAPDLKPSSDAQGQVSASQCTPNDPLGIASAWTLSPIAAAYGIDMLPTMSRAIAAVVEPQHPTVAVVDADEKRMPKRLLDHFARGGTKSGLADIDANDVATRNWLYSQLAGATAYAGDNWNWLRHSIGRQTDGAFKLVRAQVSYVRGQVRIYFSGYSKANPVFGQGGHGPGNAKILQIFSGVGSTSSSFRSAVRGIAGTFKGNALVSFVFGSAASWAEWQADTQKDGYDLAASLLTGLLKALVASALTVIVVAAVVAVSLLVIGGSVAALVIGLLTIAAGFVMNYVVEAADKQVGKAWTGEHNSDGIAAGVAPWLRSASEWVSGTWDYLKSKMPNDYGAIAFP